MSPNMRAFLDTLAHSEIGPALLAESDNGYNVLVGSTPAHPLLFTDYSTHPKIHNVETNSDAAGRYQFMGRYWAPYKAQLHLPDFGPASQDLWCQQLIRECHATAAVESGDLENVVELCRSRWASLPGAGYGQHENSLSALRAAFVAAGGTLC